MAKAAALVLFTIKEDYRAARRFAIHLGYTPLPGSPKLGKRMKHRVRA